MGFPLVEGGEGREGVVEGDGVAVDEGDDPVEGGLLAPAQAWSSSVTSPGEGVPIPASEALGGNPAKRSTAAAPEPEKRRASPTPRCSSEPTHNPDTHR